MWKFMPLIKVYTLNVLYKNCKCRGKVSFLSVKRARKYFDVLNKNNEYEVSLEISTLKLW